MQTAQATTSLPQKRTDDDVEEIGALCETNPRAVAEKFAPLIWKVIGRMARRLPPYVQADDLYGVGALGLMDAVEKFDASKGTAFPSYAEYRIRGAILDELRHRDPMPRVLRSRFKGVARELEKLRHSLGREPTEIEAAECAGMTLARYQSFRLQVERATTISYNDALAGYYAEGASSHGPSQNAPVAGSAFTGELGGEANTDYAAFENLFRREKLRLITDRIGELEERDQIIMALHYQEGLNFRQIGEILDLTESRISQIHKAILLALRAQLSDQS
jgi:RNA polymerase sigma factor FliA